jgi:hypothetical protein
MTDMSNTIVTNIFLKDSPAFHLYVRGDNISVTHVRIEANIEACAGYESAPNTGEKRCSRFEAAEIFNLTPSPTKDGINIGGRHIYVADSWVHNGDDCVPTNTFL